jgi:hypothetical protein
MILVTTREQERSLGKPKCKWKDNIEMHLKAIGCNDVEWNHLNQSSAQLRSPVSCEMRLRFE